MIYLYFDSAKRVLYAYNSLKDMAYNGGRIATAKENYEAMWENVEAVSGDKERGMIVAISSKGTGTIAEFPFGHSMLTCQRPS